MKLKFSQSGGFGGLVLGCDLDTETMPPAEADELIRLVRRAALNEVGARRSSSGRDLVSYEIVVQEQGRKTRAVFDDMTMPQTAGELLDFLSQRARARPLEP